MPGYWGDALPYVPPQDGARLAVLVRALEWELDNVAHALPTGRCHVDRVRGVAATMRSLADHLGAVTGIVPGEIAESEELPE